MKGQISAMIVDDEPLAREGLLMRIQATDCMSVVCSCASANEAMLSIEKLLPDVVFLDIEMPGMSGIEFARWIQQHLPNSTKIVFVTAFREFALNAFEFEAFDYLLKPFADERFDNCIAKLKAAFGQTEVVQEHEKLDKLLVSKTGNNINKFMQSLEKAEPGKLKDVEKTISLKSGTEWLRVKVDSILWIEAAGDYMCVHTQDGTHIIRKTLKQFQDDLDDDQFTRVNRSAIINMSKLNKLSPNSNGEYIASLSSGDNIKVTRKYKLQLDELNPN
jgi:two-component system LytT family response regulator